LFAGWAGPRRLCQTVRVPDRGELRNVHERPAYRTGMLLVRAIGLIAVLAGCFSGAHPPGPHPRGVAELLALVLGAAAWIGWMAAGRRRRAVACAVLGMSLGGAVLAGLDPDTPGIAFSSVAAMTAGSTGDLLLITVAPALAVLALAVSTLIVGGSLVLMVFYAALVVVGVGAGFARLGYVQRADQAEALLEQTRLTRAAEARAAALAERTRIAREIHDILAHSLGALTLQVEAAHARLSAPGAPSGDPAVVKALANLERAGSLARAGLADTRRAVHALREDPGLLPELLAELSRAAEENGREGAVTVRSTGSPRRLPPDATAALFRAAQEALTNAAKHAPGRDVELDLEFREREVVLTAVNALPEQGRERPLAASGAGYGLTGLRERAELAGGTMTAQELDDAWRVRVTVPG
jgi:signal transduction histidine kinase